MLRTFNVERTAQAAGVLLQAEEGHRMKYIRLLKLLYVADRESIRQTGFPITGDTVYAMKNGPVLSTTYNLLKGKAVDAEAEQAMPIWKQWIRTVSDYYAELAADPGFRKLTRREMETLKEVSARYTGRDPWTIIRELHSELPEWEKNYPGDGSSHLISARDILEAVGQGENAEYILATAEEHEVLTAPLVSSALR